MLVWNMALENLPEIGSKSRTHNWENYVLLLSLEASQNQQGKKHYLFLETIKKYFLS